MRRLHALLLLSALLGACNQPRQEIGVDVFSNDTIPALFEVNVTGTLAIGLRSNGFHMRPDKTLVLETPASLVIQKGAGTATINTLDTVRAVAVQPIGTPPDSADMAGVIGKSVRMTRVGEQSSVRLEVLKK